MGSVDEKQSASPRLDDSTTSLNVHDLVNTSGHVQELDRTWSIWAIAAEAIISNNAWGAGAGSLVLA